MSKKKKGPSIFDILDFFEWDSLFALPSSGAFPSLDELITPKEGTVSEEKKCGNCNHWITKGGNDGTCQVLSGYLLGMKNATLLGTPVSFYCKMWEPRPSPAPTEYRPGDGPFWARQTALADWWDICQSGKDDAIVVIGGIPATGNARKAVNLLNAACREWAGKWVLEQKSSVWTYEEWLEWFKLQRKSDD